MGGVKSRPKITYSAPCIKKEPIKQEIIKETKITKYNYESKLRPYNLKINEMKKIKAGLFCKSRVNHGINKFVFNNLGSGIFEMTCYTFKIKTNSDNEKDVEIVKNKLRYIANANREYEKKGWGILFWYKKSYTESRSLNYYAKYINYLFKFNYFLNLYKR